VKETVVKRKPNERKNKTRGICEEDRGAVIALTEKPD